MHSAVVIDETPIPVSSPPGSEKIFLSTVGTRSGNLCHNAEVLDDSGCMGMVVSSRFLQRVGIVARPTAHPVTVRFAKPELEIATSLECELWVRIGKWAKCITFSVLT